MGQLPLLVRLRIIYYFSCPRTWLYALLGFHFGYYLGSGGDLGWKLWVGDLIYGPIGTGATNFINMVWDQKEDSINKPIRSVYIKYITAAQLTAITWVFYLLSLVLSGLFSNWAFILWCLLSIFHSHQYSAPPFRFKKHWLTNNTYLSFGSCTVPFLAGWTLCRPLTEMPLIPIFLQFVFVLLTLISKDVPDLEGDKFAKLSTIPLDFSLKHYKVLSYGPALLSLALIASGLLELRYLLFSVVCLLFLSVMYTRDTDSKLRSHERRITHFVFLFTYSQMGDCLLYSLMFPAFAYTFGFVTAIVSFAFIFTAGYLYPSAKCGVEAANPQHGG